MVYPKILKTKMKHLVIILVFTLCALNCSSQQIDSVNFNKIFKEYYIKYFKTTKYRFDGIVSLADTTNVAFYIPRIHLKETSDTLLGYQRISPYIEKKFSPHNMSVIISNKQDLFVFLINKETEEILRKIWLELTNDIIPYENYLYLSKAESNFEEADFPYDKGITYRQIKQYLDANPNTILFTIFRIPGIWGYKDGRLIKLIFYTNVVEEMDGEKYYREYLFPLSPMGIKRTINTESFIPYICN